jgi:hypothetical protein
MWERSVGRLKLRALIPHCNAVIAPSRELAEKSQFLRVLPEHIHYIPNGVDTEAYDGRTGRDTVRERFQIEPQTPIVLSARRFDPKNGLIFFAKAIPKIIREFPTAQILFVGDGAPEEKRRIVDCIESAGVAAKVKFAGAVPNCEMHAYYAAADICVIPSLREATSLTCLESMASGIPVVATAVGGLPELVTHELEGLLVPPSDSDALATSILTLLLDKGRRRTMGEAGRRKVLREYSWDHIAERTIVVFEDVLRGARLANNPELCRHAAKASAVRSPWRPA